MAEIICLGELDYEFVTIPASGSGVWNWGDIDFDFITSAVTVMIDLGLITEVLCYPGDNIVNASSIHILTTAYTVYFQQNSLNSWNISAVNNNAWSQNISTTVYYNINSPDI